MWTPAVQETKLGEKQPLMHARGKLCLRRSIKMKKITTIVRQWFVRPQLFTVQRPREVIPNECTFVRFITELHNQAEVQQGSSQQ